MTSKADILTLIEEEDVEFIRLQFTDIMGNLKNIAITPNQLERAYTDMFPFKSKALFDDVYDCKENYYLKPDYDTFVILPWRPQQSKVAKLVCDVCSEDGKELNLSTRQILKNVLEQAKSMGYEFMVNPECEFFLYHTDENSLPTSISHDKAGYMDVGPVDFGENARRDIVLNLEEMGFDVLSSHHESAPAQHEVDFGESDALSCADAIQTFRFAVRSIAHKFGLYATFMPKPKSDQPGSGMHTNFVMLEDGKNAFRGMDGEISELGKSFIAGVLAHGSALCAVTNPIVNSYKRLIGGFEAPCKIAWCTKGEKSMVIVDKSFEDVKIKIRTPDGAANPYLMIAGIIASGLDGIKKGLILEEDAFGQEEDKNDIPSNLKQAIDSFSTDLDLLNAFGEEFVAIYSSIKNEEWKEYQQAVSEWELDRYLTRM